MSTLLVESTKSILKADAADLLKGQCQKIFDIRFFSGLIFLRAPEDHFSARSNLIPIFLKKCATQGAPLVSTTPVWGKGFFLYFVESSFDYRLNFKRTLSLSDTRVFDTVCKFIVSVIDTKGKFSVNDQCKSWEKGVHHELQIFVRIFEKIKMALM